MGDGPPESKSVRRSSSISAHGGSELSHPAPYDPGAFSNRNDDPVTTNQKNRHRYEEQDQHAEGKHGHPQEEEQEEEEQDPLLTGTDAQSDRSRRSSFAESEVLEMDFLGSDDDLNDDEETGLTARERRQRWKQRKRHRRELDARVVEVKISEGDRRLADKAVIKRLAVNAILIGLWYIFSLSISIYNKWMFSSDHLDFQFPLFTTGLHMAVQFTLSSLVLYFVPSLRPHDPSSSHSAITDQPRKPLVSKQFYFSRLVPCGAATSLDVGLGNMSLRFVTLTFLTMCKSSSLAFVLLFAFVFRLEAPSLKLILIIGTMTIGVVMMVAGEAAFNALGFTLIIASAFFSGFRWGLTQILLLRHPSTANPFSMLFFITPIMFVCLTVLALAVEGPQNIIQGISILVADGIIRGIGILLFPGCLAFCMIASEFALLKRSSVVTLSICGIFKEVITISAAGIVFHDPLTPINVSGLIITIAAIASYNYMKITKMRREARLDVAENANPIDADSDVEESQMPSASNNLLTNNDTNSNHSINNTTNASSLATRLGLSVNTSASNKDSTYSPIDTTIPTDETTLLTPGGSGEDRGQHSIRARVAGAASGASSLLVASAAGASGAGAGAGDPSLRSPLRNSFKGSSSGAGGDVNANDSSLSSSSSSSASSARVPTPGVLQRSLSWKARSLSPRPPLPSSSKTPSLEKMSRD
ncbi:hypothetical protein AJ78_02680 [Emergomyces pasteurianus Ep9510]|uniref:Sugar phosphate transporter domain-containing protein n=1 Tax=Emergomyces pasteurianus Ep9510 TaxID=1447872 RepID=A0A1J9QAC4_9EURO|nr:hypothetical protein AJ78_02680 [Emergomyces pasteurianus Ep9510]